MGPKHNNLLPRLLSTVTVMIVGALLVVGGILLYPSFVLRKEMLEGRSTIHRAASAGNTNKVASIISRDPKEVNRPGRLGTPLHEAASEGHLPIVVLLVQNGADINARTPLASRTPLHKASEDGHLPVVEYLLGHGADPNARADLDETPLHWAARAGHEHIVRKLLESGATPNLRDHAGRTPAEWAHKQNHHDIAKLLETSRE